MNSVFRDNVLSKNKVLLHLTLAWAVTATIAVFILGGICVHVVNNKETHWLPICTEDGYFLSNSSFSPSYIKDMTKKVIQLRLTYNPDTVAARFASLVHLIPASHQEAFKTILDSESTVAKEKNISSVFYEKNIHIDESTLQAKVDGTLNRTSHGLEVKPQKKVYLVQFAHSNGMMWPKAIKEIRQ